MNKKIRWILGLLILGCLSMSFVDGVLHPAYFTKSMIKLVFFLILPILFSIKVKDRDLLSFFSLQKKTFVYSLLLGVFVYVLILGAYLLLGSFFDFSGVTTALEKNIGVTRDNFLYVALYISFMNSLLEEFFFRGFGFLNLKKHFSRKVSYIVSAGCFALYHLSMMDSWFSLPLYFLLIISLFISGLLFNFLDERSGSIFPSWFVHMFANFSINTVGLILFGLLPF